LETSTFAVLGMQLLGSTISGSSRCTATLKYSEKITAQQLRLTRAHAARGLGMHASTTAGCWLMPSRQYTLD